MSSSKDTKGNAAIPPPATKLADAKDALSGKPPEKDPKSGPPPVTTGDEEELTNFFTPTQEELDAIEEESKDMAKRYTMSEALGLQVATHDRKILLGVRSKLVEIIPLLDSTIREVRVGALAALIECARQDTLVSKKDIKLLIGRLQPKEQPRPLPSVSAKKPPKEDSPAVKAVKAKYPNSDQRGKDSDYAREIRIARNQS